MLKSLFSGTVLGLALSIPAMAQDADTVVAHVNGEAVTLGQMLLMKENIGGRADALPDQALWDLLLDQLVRQASVAQAGEGRMTARDIATIQLSRRAYLASVALERVALPEPTEDELEAQYARMFPLDTPQTEYNAAHILLQTEPAAKAALAEIRDGRDFAQVAREKSTGPTGPTGGDLGWITADSVVPEFGEALVQMEPGDVSAPVKTQFGWHVIKLMQSRPMDRPQFDEIRDELITQIRRKRVEDEISKLVDEAEVDKAADLPASLLQKTNLLKE